MAAVLRPISRHDPRPDPTNPRVVARAVGDISAELLSWAHLNVNPDLAGSNVEALIVAHILESGFDAFRAAAILSEENLWRCDIRLVRLLDGAINALEAYARSMTLEWVVRTGLRFPANEGDEIQWITVSGRLRKGTVYALNPYYAMGLVNPKAGPAKASSLLKVYAEQVTANDTKGRFAQYALAHHK
jgi:hypothetical protein